MNSLFPSFLSENENRAFPFLEDSLPPFGNAAFLDLRCWTKLKLIEMPRLFGAYVYGDIPDGLMEPFIREGFLNIFFEVHYIDSTPYNTSILGIDLGGAIESLYGASNISIIQGSANTARVDVSALSAGGVVTIVNAGYGYSTGPAYAQTIPGSYLHSIDIQTAPRYESIVCFYVPLDNTIWPYACVSSFYGNQSSPHYGRKIFEGKLVVGQSVLQICGEAMGPDGPSEELNALFEGPYIEPSQIMEIGGTVIDSFDVISPDETPTRYLSGDIKFQPGINTSIIQSDNTITAYTALNNGLGRSVYSGTDKGACDGILMINGVQADSNGVFLIKGENGIIVTDYPNEHKIKISIDPNNPAFQCPPQV